MITSLVKKASRGVKVVDKKKIILMTRLAIYEKQQEKKELHLSKYYKSDFVRYHGLKALVAATLAYWLTVAVVIFMQFEVVLEKINEIDYFNAVYSLMLGYAVFAFVNMTFAFIVYSYRYKASKKGILNYNRELKKLIEYYEGDSSVGVIINEQENDKVIDREPNEQQQIKINKSVMLSQRERELQIEKERVIRENVKRLKEREEMNRRLEMQRRENYNKLVRNNVQMQPTDNEERRN